MREKKATVKERQRDSEKVFSVLKNVPYVYIYIGLNENARVWIRGSHR